MLERHRVTLCATPAPWLAFALLMAAALPIAADPLPAPEETPLLRVSGNIAHPNVGEEAHFDRRLLEALPPRELATSTVVTDGVNHFEGVLMRDLLERVGAEGDTAVATALNDYVVDIPLEDFHDFDVVVATHMDGEKLTPRDKGPLWIVYPRDDHSELQDIRYDYRWVWQLERLEIQ
ncbi:molybdopterin-dependent oxidoreductase [Halomonas campisalis]|uniref:Molybdopterin-dependent oxidoreductase n=1 Tax=Billgrantia campisalis TaxID=74661 RepID=A0ABS9P7A8_9GAMM|nr:molybdopterin-dependent oxidoreductase [Halomonas campisalis]MCG6657666.1 molybdopterin-dependent oxidoreductase [Halomonas campisalis]MDR5862562.1 molybdopterin-dependent oxidoreductase [Halomonas campisalis]